MRTTSSVALAVVLSLAAAGCGSSKKAATSATTAAATATTAAPAATTAAPAATTAAPAATTAAPAATTAAAAGVATTAAAEVTTAKAAVVAGDKNVTIAVITNGDDGEFWAQVRQGAEQAGKDLGINVTYEGANNNSEGQVKLIDQAVINKVSGLAIAVADANALTGAAAKVTNASIPLVTLNSGVEQYKELGAITHVGQSERDAGRGAGERLKAAGGTVMLCARPDGSVGQVARCQGAAETFAPGKVVELVTSGDAKPDASQAEVKATLSADSSIDAVLATSPVGAVLASKAAVELNKKIAIGAVDLSAPLLDAIEKGDVAFTIDQQQYTQGYLSVVVLYLNLTSTNAAVGGQPISAGPSFVDKTNVVAVKELFTKGRR
jgi:simple sugar transport system substrate-binding protein